MKKGWYDRGVRLGLFKPLHQVKAEQLRIKEQQLRDAIKERNDSMRNSVYNRNKFPLGNP